MLSKKILYFLEKTFNFQLVEIPSSKKNNGRKEKQNESEIFTRKSNRNLYGKYLTQTPKILKNSTTPNSVRITNHFGGYETQVSKNISAKVFNSSHRNVHKMIQNPKSHQPWRCYRVIAGHLGWVRSIAIDPTNQWFCSGSSDRTIKIWDIASGELKLTLTGHIEQVTGLSVSRDHPYMFSCGLDKMVKCWDLEYNKVIRSYHGHLSGVYCLTLHPIFNLIFTGGRDSVCRVWDIRTKVQINCLSGHESTVGCVLALPRKPEIVTGSYDSTIRLWIYGRVML